MFAINLKEFFIFCMKYDRTTDLEFADFTLLDYFPVCITNNYYQLNQKVYLIVKFKYVESYQYSIMLVLKNIFKEHSDGYLLYIYPLLLFSFPLLLFSIVMAISMFVLEQIYYSYSYNYYIINYLLLLVTLQYYLQCIIISIVHSMWFICDLKLSIPLQNDFYKM